jgi:hypothetical protein
VYDDCVPPEEPGTRVSDDFDRGELDMLATGRVLRELDAVGVCVSPRVGGAFSRVLSEDCAVREFDARVGAPRRTLLWIIPTHIDGW